MAADTRVAGSLHAIRKHPIPLHPRLTRHASAPRLLWCAVRSISPKLCLSEESLELATSANCALQYIVGLHIEPAQNLALLSYGEFDRRMKLATLPLDKVLAFARTHDLSTEGGEVSISECGAGAA